jgi:thiamine-phosphate pyrophosphorylase
MHRGVLRYGALFLGCIRLKSQDSPGPIFRPAFPATVANGESVTEAAKSSARLILVTPVVEDAVGFAPLLEACCREGDVAAVILNLATEDEVMALSAIRIVSTHLQGTGAVLLLSDRPGLVEASGADGAHFSNLDQLQTTRANLAAGRLSGVGSLASRHDTMVAAESGVDFVIFGEPDASGKRPGFSALVERISWWAEIFQLPCVAFAGSIDEVSRLAEARADFVALGDAVWSAGDNAPQAVAKATQLLRLPEAA